MEILDLPVSCDLSQSALGYALQLGTEKGFGIALNLLSTPEDRAVGKALVETISHLDGEGNSHKLEYKMIPTFPERHWEVVFEKGIVQSQGPVFNLRG